MKRRFSRSLGIVAAALSAALAASASFAAEGRSTLPLYVPGAGITPQTSHTSPPSDWRLTAGMTFNGVGFDGLARIAFDSDGDLDNGFYVCSGALLAGGRHVLTAGHCADNFNVMQIDFGVYDNVATATRGAAAAHVNPGWDGTLSVGADIAVIQLDAPVVGIQGFNVSTSNDVGSPMLIMGHGTTTTGDGQNGPPGWDEWGWAHFGWNEADVGAVDFNNAVDPGNDYTYFGDEYVFDFDNGRWLNNTLQRIANKAGASFSSSRGLGADEALIAGGDSGGPDFVWSGSEWLLAGVHSWGWQYCRGRIFPSCDVNAGVASSYGDLSGSTAVYSHAAWIDSVVAIPEPGSYGMMAMGLLAVAGFVRRRRRA
ncbi:MAG: trypsin-like serine protease [Burkholderiales bacterium]|nr:trypsin-like serine protease [Burkholderiales bacterium]